jgi:hypothetical protein
LAYPKNLLLFNPFAVAPKIIDDVVKDKGLTTNTTLSFVNLPFESVAKTKYVILSSGIREARLFTEGTSLMFIVVEVTLNVESIVITSE